MPGSEQSAEGAEHGTLEELQCGESFDGSVFVGAGYGFGRAESGSYDQASDDERPVFGEKREQAVEAIDGGKESGTDQEPAARTAP